MALGISRVSAQHVKVASQIVDVNSRVPVAYASVGLLVSYKGTVTDEEGHFRLMLPPKDSMLLKVSALGYESLTIPADQVRDTIFLTPASYMLKEVIVQGASLDPRMIVKHAFGAISKNYHKEPIMLETFYRHYCQDDSVYGRIIEAAADIYKKRGYGKRENYDANKDFVRVKELRRSLDNTNRNKADHAPMSLNLIQESDIVALKEKPGNESKELSLFLSRQDFVNPKNKSFDFEMIGITAIDSEQVYEVMFRYHQQKESRGLGRFDYRGRFFINTSNYAILRVESHTTFKKSEFSQTVSYKRFGDKYALSHSLITSREVNRHNQEHKIHVELTVTNLLTGRQKGFDRTEIDREYLATVPYRAEFWAGYPLVKARPVPKRVQQDLQAEVALEQQYEEVVEYEARFTNETKKDEQTLLRTIEENKGILVVDLWAAWCTPCIQEYVVSEYNRKALSEKGVQFLMVSVDSDLGRWRNTVELFEMTREKHLKIGPNAKFLRPLKMEGIPRYLVYQGQTLVTDKAPRPSTREFKELVEGLLAKGIN